jgi:hypothetical protein
MPTPVFLTREPMAVYVIESSIFTNLELLWGFYLNIAADVLCASDRKTISAKIP